MKRLGIIRGTVLITLLALIVGGTLTSVAYEPTALGTHHVRDPANTTTYIAAQGFHFNGNADETKPGRLVAVSPTGTTKWTYNGTTHPSWFYDVEPVNETAVFVTVSKHDHVDGVLLNTKTQTPIWRESFDAQDTHDIDYNKTTGTLLVAPMHKDYYKNGQNVYNDRAYAYDRTNDTVNWSWAFNTTYQTPSSPPRTGWTHLNDIDSVDNDTVMLSPRNFNRVIFLNTTSQTINHTLTLGEQDDPSIIHRQHNPDVISTNPLTVLVADSENNRVVEYKRTNGTWKRTWTLTGTLNWPRDADRLPNGNTLVTDTLNHRVIEVTPNGSVVWEYYAPWAPYDADRSQDGSHGPPMHTVTNNTTATVHGDILGGTETAGHSNVCGEEKSVPNPNSVPTKIKALTTGTPLESLGTSIASQYANVVPWLRPRWMSPWAFPLFASALTLTLAWGTAELVRYGYSAYARK